MVTFEQNWTKVVDLKPRLYLRYFFNFNDAEFLVMNPFIVDRKFENRSFITPSVHIISLMILLRLLDLREVKTQNWLKISALFIEITDCFFLACFWSFDADHSFSHIGYMI